MRRCTVLLCLGAALVLPSAAGAAPGLSPEVVVGANGPGTGAVVARMSPGGYGLVAWSEGRRGAGYVVRVSTHAPGGVWTPPENLGGVTDRKLTLNADIADSGAAAVGFGERADTTGARTTAVVASRAPGAAWAPAEAMTEQSQSAPRVGVDAAGAVTLLYTGDGNVRERRFPAGTPALAAAPVVLQEGCGVATLDVAPSGDAIAGLSCGIGLAYGARFVQRRGGAWGAPLDIPQAGEGCPTSGTQTTVSDPQVAIGSDGDVAAAYTTTTTVTPDCTMPAPTSTSQIVALRGAALTPDATPVTSADGPASLGDVSLALRPGGLLVTWTRTSGGTEIPVTQTLARDLPGEAQVVDGLVGAAELAGGASGHALLAGAGAFDGTRTPQVVTSREPGAPFAPAAELTPGATVGADAVAMSDAGDGLYAYSLYDGTATSVRVRGYDVTAPLIAAPGAYSVAAGRSTRLPVNAVDVSGPVALQATFGDKSAPATALPLRHRYRKPGRYRLDVTATDAVGHVTTGTVLVRAVRVARLSRLSVTPKRARRTVRVRYRLDRRARVRVTLQQRVGKTFKTRQTTVKRGRKGANRVSLRIKRPRAGRWRVLARPVTGGVDGIARTAGLRVR